jgi:hypothetical protein
MIRTVAAYNLKILFSWAIVAFFQMYKIYGQSLVCTPAAIYKDSAAGIYPRPFNDSTKQGGITKIACIDTEYEFPLTVNIPERVIVPIGASQIEVALESARMDTVGAVKGLPPGLNYFCNAPNCSYNKNKLGCIVIRGNVTADTKPGIYDLVINMKLVTLIGTFDVAFPGSLFPGKYFITVAAKSSAGCSTTQAVDQPALQSEWKLSPNPVSQGQINIFIQTAQAGAANLVITDMAGQKIRTDQIKLNKGINQFQIASLSLPDGIYFYTLYQSGIRSTRKFIVAH